MKGLRRLAPLLEGWFSYNLQDFTLAVVFLGGTIPISLLSNNHVVGVITGKVVGLPFLTILSLDPN
ncbi:hypothetical protein IMY05_012G0027500 [Salix suchowensis]|nr:hypothetical protein IMY05_012G0027500 [Salix suchowensis]